MGLHLLVDGLPVCGQPDASPVPPPVRVRGGKLPGEGDGQLHGAVNVGQGDRQGHGEGCRENNKGCSSQEVGFGRLFQSSIRPMPA